MKPAKRQRQKKKGRTWTTPVVLGLILSAFGALSVIELRPQISVSPKPERATNQPFSAPFELTNTGYLSFHVDNVVVILPTAEYQGRLSLHNSMTGDVDWDDFDLDRGSATTIYPYFADGMPTKASIVIAVDYNYFWVNGRWLTRFDGTHIDNWQWAKQPIKEDDKPNLNRIVDEALAKHRQVNSRYKP